MSENTELNYSSYQIGFLLDNIDKIVSGMTQAEIMDLMNNLKCDLEKTAKVIEELSKKNGK